VRAAEPIEEAGTQIGLELAAVLGERRLAEMECLGS
jgi:hypothetical protein